MPRKFTPTKTTPDKYSLMHKKPELSIYKNCISEMFRKQLHFLPVFYLNMCFMKVQKNFGKITILKI